MEKQPGEQEEEQQQGSQQTQEIEVDWESDSNPYKKRYGDSQGQVTPLVNTLKNFAEYDHNTKTWKPKSQKQESSQEGDDDVEKLLEGYDPDFKKNLKVYTERQIDAKLKTYNERNTYVENYNKGVTSARAKAIEDFGDEYEFAKGGNMNPASPLYKLADKILTSEYSRFEADGTFHSYTTPDAEYLATVKAFAKIKRQEKAGVVTGKNKLGAIQGKGGGTGGSKGKLSFEEYQKLSDEEKDNYDLSQMK